MTRLLQFLPWLVSPACAKAKDFLWLSQGWAPWIVGTNGVLSGVVDPLLFSHQFLKVPSGSLRNCRPVDVLNLLWWGGGVGMGTSYQI